MIFINDKKLKKKLFNIILEEYKSIAKEHREDMYVELSSIVIDYIEDSKLLTLTGNFGLYDKNNTTNNWNKSFGITVLYKHFLSYKYLQGVFSQYL